MSSETPDPQLTALARALAGLAPASGAIDRDRLMFQAGRHSARRRGSHWLTLAFALAAVALGAGWLAWPPRERVVFVSVTVREPAAPAVPVADKPRPPDEGPPPRVVQPPAAPQGEYLRLWNLVLQSGVDALPKPPPIVAPTQAPRDLESWLDVPPGTLRRPGFFPWQSSANPGDSL